MCTEVEEEDRRGSEKVATTGYPFRRVQVRVPTLAALAFRGEGFQGTDAFTSALWNPGGAGDVFAG